MEEQNPLEWGVDDEDFFRFVLEHSEPEPTFNLIMSTSYHPPYSVDVEKKGFDPTLCNRIRKVYPHGIIESFRE